MSVQDDVKKSCPLCEKQYLENDNYCQTDGSLLQIADADYGARVPSKSEEEICSG